MPVYFDHFYTWLAYMYFLGLAFSSFRNYAFSYPSGGRCQVECNHILQSIASGVGPDSSWASSGIPSLRLPMIGPGVASGSNQGQ